MMDETIETGLYAPDYYSRFQCIADRCRHSCCIDWEICIDAESYAKYQQMDDIFPTVKICEDGPCFSLDESGRCPHLNDEGLCKIILSHGEAYLSEICRLHPRFFNVISPQRTEVGIGIVCEEACRLILEDRAPLTLTKIGETTEDAATAPAINFDPLPPRARMLAIVEEVERFDDTVAALNEAFALPAQDAPAAWLDRFLGLEILDPDWERDLRAAKAALPNACRADLRPFEPSYKRLLTYFIYRHVSTAADEIDLRARLAFSILSVEMIRALFAADASPTLEKLVDLSRRYSAEIEYSEDNTAELIFACQSRILSKSKTKMGALRK